MGIVIPVPAVNIVKYIAVVHGFQTSTPNPETVGADANVDNDDDGRAVLGQAYISSGVINLISGTEPGLSGNFNNTVDFGFVLDADLSVTQVASTITPNVGQNVTFTVSVTNSGPDSTSSVVISDVLPGGLTYISSTVDQGDYDSTMGRWTVGSLAANSTSTLQLVARVDTSGAKTNIAQIIASDRFDPDSTPANNIATEDDQVSVAITPQRIDLSLTKIANPPRPNVGQQVTFTLSAMNGGPDAATQVSIRDRLPNGLIFVSANPSSGIYDPITGVWSIPTIANTATATLTLVATYDVPTNITNTAEEIAADQFDVDSTPANNAPNEDDIATVTLMPAIADVTVDLTVSDATANPGDLLTYTLVARNAGPSEAQVVTFVDVLSSGLTFVSGIGPAGQSLIANGQVVSDTVGTLAPNATATYTINAVIDSGFVGQVGSTVVIATTTYEGDNPLPDTGSVETAVNFASGLVGQVSCDANGNQVVDAGEAMAGVVVFIDTDGNRLLGTNELNTVTDSAGNYHFNGAQFPMSPTAIVVVQNPPSCVPVVPDFGVTRATVTTGNMSRAIDTADFDLDGDMDLLVVNEIDDNVSVLLNDQNKGAFAPGSTIELGNRPQAIATWQPNASVAPVIAVAAIGTFADQGTLYIIENGSTRQLSVGNGPVSVVADDFNGDGKADFVATAFRSGTIVGRMSGESDEKILATARSPRSVKSGFINDDAFLDLVVVATGYQNDDSSEVVLLLGDGHGSFTSRTQSVSGRGFVDVAIANFDADSAEELVIANYDGSATIFDYSNDQLRPVTNVTTGKIGVESIAARDINQDGRVDLVIANAREETIELFVNTGSGFVRNKTIMGVASPSGIVIEKFDLDNILDVVVSNLYGKTSPNFSLPSTATILGLTVAERAVTIVSDATTTANFQYVTPSEVSAVSADTKAITVTMSAPTLPYAAILPVIEEGRYDVDNNGAVSPLDALVVINSTSRRTRISGEANSAAIRFAGRLDVNRDGLVSAIDALQILNFLSRRRSANIENAANVLAAPLGSREGRLQAFDTVMS